jgi:hypothetical protein
MILSSGAKRTTIAVLIVQLLLISIVIIHYCTRSLDTTLLRTWINLVPVSATAFSAADPGTRFPVLRFTDRDRLDVLRDSDPLLFQYKPDLTE